MRYRTRCVAIALVISLVVLLRPSYAEENNVQRKFDLAGQAIASGDLQTAANILEELSLVSPTPRILLERARVAFLRGEYRRSQHLFDELRKTEILPLRVRETIEVYDRLIKQNDSWWQYDVSLVAVQNPERQMSASTINIDGLVYKVHQTNRQDTVYGLRHTLSGATRPSQGLRFAGDIEFDDMEQGRNDTERYSARVLFSPDHSKFRYTLGYYGERRDHKLRFTMPYMSFERIFDGWKSLPFIASASVQSLDVKAYNYADATSLKIGGTQFLNRDQSTALQTFFEKSWAREHYWSHDAKSFGFFHTLYDEDKRFKVMGAVRVRKSDYAAPDPFFARQRSDISQNYNLTLTHQNWIIHGRQLGLGFRFEKNHSNLPIQSYESQGIYLTLG